MFGGFTVHTCEQDAKVAVQCQDGSRKEFAGTILLVL
jgi:hypothetical protein